MNSLRIPFRGKVYHFQFASTWDELKPKTLHKLLPLIAETQAAFHIYQEDNYKEAADLRLQELRIKIVWLLLDLPWYAFFKKRAFLSLFADELSDILDACDFLLEQPQRNAPPFAEIKAGNLRLFTLGDALRNLSELTFNLRK